MRESFEIKSYIKVDNHLEDIITLHKYISKDTLLEGKFIYFDTNFSPYITNLIENSDKDFFYVAKVEDILCGFIHLKVFDNTIFLNNISILEKFQGYGLGKMLLIRGIKQLYNQSIKSFSLDVFISNAKAYNWYKKMGLVEINRNVWKKIDNTLFLNNGNLSVERKDNNGFNSIFVDKLKIATIINDNIIMLHDLESMKSIDAQKRLVYTNQDLSSLDKFNYSICETSARMTGEINLVIKNLNMYV